MSSLQITFYPKNSFPTHPPPLNLPWKFLFRWFFLWKPSTDHTMQVRHFFLDSHSELSELLISTLHYNCFYMFHYSPDCKLFTGCSFETFSPAFPSAHPCLISEWMIYWVLDFWDHRHTSLSYPPTFMKDSLLSPLALFFNQIKIAG